MHVATKLKLVGISLYGLLAFRWFLLYHQSGCVFAFSDPVILCCLASLFVVWDIVRRRPGQYFGILSVFPQYFIQRTLLTCGWVMYRRFRKMSQDIQLQQDKVLKQILSRNSGTLVAKELGVSKVVSATDYRKTVRLTTYNDYWLFANMVEEAGTSDVFFPGEADYIAFTSGTTSGKSKAFPKSSSLLQNTTGRWLLLALWCFHSVLHGAYLRKWLSVKTSVRFWNSSSGVVCGPISGLVSRCSLSPYLVPDLTMKDMDSVIYVNLLFGLKHRDIGHFFFSTSQAALIFFQTLETEWQKLCKDIETGVVNKELNLSEKDRFVLNQSFGGPDKDRADEVRKEIQSGFQGIVGRLWPECPGLFCLATGSFKTQADLVRAHYLGDVPLFSPFHAGTETIYGMNLHYEGPEVTYTLMAPYIYFEFIPIELTDDPNPTTVVCNQVEVGRRYELVVTTWEGLYRYRTEDIIEVTGFYSTVPTYRFIRRRNDVLSVFGERVPEALVCQAVRSVIEHWNMRITECVAVESSYLPFSPQPQTCDRRSQYHYTVFIELRQDETVTDKHNEMIDVELMRLHDMYANFRQGSQISALQLIQVRTGTFQHLGTLIRATNPSSSVMQFKLPRIIRNHELLSYLLQNSMFLT